MKVMVVCDLCGWFTEKQNIADWLNKPCPKCKKGVIINEKDIEMYKIAVGMKGMSDAIKKEFPNEKMVKVHMNTAPLREGKPPTFEEVK
jgi:phage FluMu protein Com